MICFLRTRGSCTTFFCNSLAATWVLQAHNLRGIVDLFLCLHTRKLFHVFCRSQSCDSLVVCENYSLTCHLIGTKCSTMFVSFVYRSQRREVRSLLHYVSYAYYSVLTRYSSLTVVTGYQLAMRSMQQLLRIVI